ncbi:MAG: NAD(P)/FAD-dependent oxidoreductase [Candidatus Marinimicrobia bacterium]|jgi:L-2-hydroxyglutarate oxidase LhgO|nr:NAD(P)/FAD-dependent oxidoreductase [Candidatus Neomarinimicrobiota bacterium]MDP6593278.1 NAD(P)/FAD-dependent oxidoreductase [Candidatus Neomarinimicrobiota bacterium]MDP6836578.1 NAD(P)/FAD-dependent oxidoreductase [Candidatus Neomarinimicrobiota bacterium]MDP6967045.1 NAD(P)/FAD-dependent oxidoreductase [Candidatus Neomarinimicrobiota bacterium]|tara:strand:- start:4937 stop:6073 length:1137 start_codon:yes stop_codon:yes gene_type:complete
MDVDYDVVIIGAGVVGLAVARALADRKFDSVLIVEREDGFGKGTSSRNSEVIHSGIYYPTNSLKARYCRLGRELIYPFCRANDVWHSRCGKLVVAQKGQEDDLDRLYRQAQANEVPEVVLMSRKEIVTVEPEVSAEAALFVGCTGIVSAHELMAAFHRYSAEADHDLLIKAAVVGADPEGDHYALSVHGPGDASYQVTTRWVVNAAGLHSDGVAQFLWGSDKKDRPVLRFSKGSYFKLTPRWRHRIQHLIYPLPDPVHDSLGIHLSFDQGGDVKLGPSAEWLEEREEDYVVREKDHDMFYTDVKQYLPALEREDLSPDFAGIRPKLADADDGPSDYYIRHEKDSGYPGWINLIGIDSPGLTAAIAIGEDVAGWIAEGR